MAFEIIVQIERGARGVKDQNLGHFDRILDDVRFPVE
jgi:hypothetical protein